MTMMTLIRHRLTFNHFVWIRVSLHTGTLHVSPPGDCPLLTAPSLLSPHRYLPSQCPLCTWASARWDESGHYWPLERAQQTCCVMQRGHPGQETQIETHHHHHGAIPCHKAEVMSLTQLRCEWHSTDPSTLLIMLGSGIIAYQADNARIFCRSLASTKSNSLFCFCLVKIRLIHLVYSWGSLKS